MMPNRLLAIFGVRRRTMCLVITCNIIFLTYLGTSLWSNQKSSGKLTSLEYYLSHKNGLSANLMEKLKHIIRADLKVTKTADVLSRPQKCKIPQLDPYHPDVKSFYRTVTAPMCDYPHLTYVTDDGFLKVRDESKVKEAKFAYMQRVNDNENTFTKWVIFYDKTNNNGVKLTEDMVKVSVTSSAGVTTEEFHIYPTRKDIPGIPLLDRDPSKLNIVFVMIDSLSHSSAERYLKKYVKRVKNKPSSIILKGHTIVGDGTTAQLCAMFVGELENRLPEARVGKPKTDFVDRWPFIFFDYNKAGYTTFYSEESPFISTFNYRLNGFKKQPTDKYLRNFWVGAKDYISKLNKQSIRCNHQLNFLYLKRFLKNYADKPTFTHLCHSEISHNNSPGSQVIDDDLIDLMDHFEKNQLEQNTILIVFGDHGDRSGSYRATLTGKLEERLPFMSFNFPRWFPKRYPIEFKNLQQNSHILTSHFDIYSTLQHLLTFPINKHKHKYGTSLFEDIVSLNRTCKDINILDHWCSCQNYRSKSTLDNLVKKAVNTVIAHINSKIADNALAKENCETLTLKSIIRAGVVEPQKQVLKFVQTFRDNKCDECGVKEGNVNYKSSNFEVVFAVSPSNGEYEATVVLNRKTGTFTATDGISRINLYKNQPHCIAKKEPYLRPFCYCKTQI